MFSRNRVCVGLALLAALAGILLLQQLRADSIPGRFYTLASSLLLILTGGLLGGILTGRGLRLRMLDPRDSEREIHHAAMARVLSWQNETEQVLKQARREASAAARAKSEFLATISHEVRTPLNGILGMCGLLEETRLEKEQLEYAETIRRRGESLKAVLDDILDYSKIEAGEVEAEVEDFDLRSFLEEISERSAVESGAKNLRFHCHLDPDLPRIMRGSPEQLRQVLENLTTNAIKFTAEGEVCICVRKLKRDSQEALVLFEVSDTGAGISQDRQPDLFEAFRQGDASATRRHGGTGLGLSIARGLVELMGGEIGVASDQDRGSTFWFTVPFDLQEMQAVPPAPRAQDPEEEPAIAGDGADEAAVTGAERALASLNQPCRRHNVQELEIGRMKDESRKREGFDLDFLMQQLMGDEALARDILTSLLDDLPRRIDALQAALRQTDAEEARREAHSIKGTAGNVGAAELRRAAMKAEQACAAEDYQALPALLETIEEEHRILRRDLQQLLES